MREISNDLDTVRRNKRSWRAPFFALVLLAFAVLAYCIFSVKRGSDAGVIPGSERLLKYTFIVENESNQILSNHSVQIFAPHDALGYQHLVDVAATHAYDFDKTAEQSNLIFTFAELAPGEVRRVVVSTKVEKSAEYLESVGSIKAWLVKHLLPNARGAIDLSSYLEAQRYIELQNPKLASAAKQFNKIEKSMLPRSVYDWVRGRMTYSGYIGVMNGALYALETRTGDCSEYSALMVAMLRLNNIPARVVAGYHSAADVMVLDKMRYHNWVEYYVGGRWHLADPQGGEFSPNINDYIAFREVDGRRQSEVRFAASHHKLAISAL